jgi:hypothetical protein
VDTVKLTCTPLRSGRTSGTRRPCAISASRMMVRAEFLAATAACIVYGCSLVTDRAIAGRRFVSCGFDRYCKLWDTETGQCIGSYTTRKIPYCVK